MSTMSADRFRYPSDDETRDLGGSGLSSYRRLVAPARYIWARRAAPTLSVTPRRTYDLHSSCREANFDTRGVLRTTRRASLSPSTQRSAALSRPPSARGGKLMIGLKVGRT